MQTTRLILQFLLAYVAASDDCGLNPTKEIPDKTIVGAQCLSNQDNWPGYIAINACGPANIETFAVNQSAKDPSWADRCVQYTNAPPNMALVKYNDTAWNSIDEQPRQPESFNCAFQFQIRSLPASGPAYIGGQDLYDISHDFRNWMGPEFDAVLCVQWL